MVPRLKAHFESIMKPQNSEVVVKLEIGAQRHVNDWFSEFPIDDKYNTLKITLDKAFEESETRYIVSEISDMKSFTDVY